MSEGIPIIFLAGMASDARFFEPQLNAFPNLRVQPWIAPFGNESVQAYAARLAPFADPGRPCLIGGASFGGIVALELASHLDARACILISSIRSPAGLPWRWRLQQPLALLGPEVLRRAAMASAWIARRLNATKTARYLNRLASPAAAFERWALCATVCWSPNPESRKVRVFHIHGSADPIFPLKLAQPDVVVPGGAHALTLTSPAAVNEFISDILRTIAKE